MKMIGITLGSKIRSQVQRLLKIRLHLSMIPAVNSIICSIPTKSGFFFLPHDICGDLSEGWVRMIEPEINFLETEIPTWWPKDINRSSRTRV